GFAAAPATPARTAERATSSAAVHAAACLMVVLIRYSFRIDPCRKGVRPSAPRGLSRLVDEVHVDRRFEGADRLAAAHQFPYRLTAFLTVVLRQLVDVHRHEAVAELRVEPAAEPERVLH